MEDTEEAISRLTRERDDAQRMAAAWEQAGANARLTERLVREDLARERASNAAHATEHARAIVAGIAGAMGLDTSGEGDEIHARILAEHARAASEHALVCEEYRRDIADLRERMTRVECDRAKLADELAAALRAARAP